MIVRMGEAVANWGDWVAGALVSLVTAAVWASILAVFAGPLTWSRRSYLHGLGASAVAFVAALGVTAVTLLVYPTVPTWALVVVMPPLLEESARLIFAMRVRSERPAWVTFGIGYGLLEGGLKIGDMLVILLRRGEGAVHVLLGTLAQVTPILLHVFLSVLVFALLRSPLPPLVVFVLAALAHGLHNWSVLAFLPHDLPALGIQVLIRCAAFVALIVLILRLFRRGAPAKALAVG